MKTSQFLGSDHITILDNTIQSEEQKLQGHQELVNFPSTAEVFRAVFENSFYANCIGNGHGKTLEANEKICKIFGYTEEEMLQLSTKEIFDTTEINYTAYLCQRESNGKAKAIVTAIRKNGERFLCAVSTVIFTDDNGEIRTINTLQDVSKKYAGAAY